MADFYTFLITFKTSIEHSITVIITFIGNYFGRKLWVSEVHEKQKIKLVLRTMELQDLCRWSVQVCLCRTVWICRTAWLPPPRGCVWEAFAPEWHEGWWAMQNQKKLGKCNETSNPSCIRQVFFCFSLLWIFGPMTPKVKLSGGLRQWSRFRTRIRVTFVIWLQTQFCVHEWNTL